ncbi:MAG: hypothetical protein WCR56_02115 [Bacilli bacterium]
MLFSCSGSKAPQAITDYLNNCSLDKALAFATTSLFTSSSVYTNLDTKAEIGSVKYTIQDDRRDMSNYHSKTVEYFTGTGAIYDSESNLYIMDTTAETVKSEDDLYVTTIVKHGYASQEDVGSGKTLTAYNKEVKFTSSDLESQSMTVFYSSDSPYYSGGIYYGGYFQYLISYYPYMSITEDNIFTYTLTDYPIKTDTEQGLYNELLHMNEYGLLIDVTQSVKNYTTMVSSSMTATSVYNQELSF